MIQRPLALWEDRSESRRVATMIPVSLGLHAMLLIAALVSGFVSPKRLPPPSYEVTLIAPVKKGTPGGGKTAPVNVPAGVPTPPPSVKASAADTTDPSALTIPASTAKPGSIATPVPNSADARAEALARLQRDAALKRMQEAAAKNATAKAPSAGGQSSDATTKTAASGEGAGDGGSEFGADWSDLAGSATYEQQIQAITRAKWLAPTWVKSAEPMQCIVRVVIGFDGKITSTSLEVPSGEAQFDASAMAALKKIQLEGGFPPPPIDLKPYLAKKGVPLRFDSRTAP